MRISAQEVGIVNFNKETRNFRRFRIVVKRDS